MKPYTSDKAKKKFRLERFNDAGDPKITTKAEKLEIKNANRSLKKGVRQQAKKQIEDALNQEEE